MEAPSFLAAPRPDLGHRHSTSDLRSQQQAAPMSFVAELEADIPTASHDYNHNHIPAWQSDGALAPIPVASQSPQDRHHKAQTFPYTHQSNMSNSLLPSVGSPGTGSPNMSSPSYATPRMPGNASASTKTSYTTPGIPRLDYKLYCPPLFELSADCTTLTTTSRHLSEDAEALAASLRAQATVPPKPMVHVKGTRQMNKVDFDIKLNLMSLLVPEDDRMRTNYIRCVAEGELACRGKEKEDVVPDIGDGGLEGWCRLFVDDKAENKSFIFKRTVTNLDHLWIEGQLRSLIASTGYKGNISITLPITHAKVVVEKTPKKLVTSLKTMFKSKAKYEVVQAIWPFATAKLGSDGRQFSMQSEESWWREWRDPIKYAVTTKRHGWVTNEDKLEALMEGKGRGFQPVDWDGEME